MSDGNNELNSINWGNVFSLSHIFKSFRMAIHPSKLLLGLAAIVLIYISGRVLDNIWGLFDQRVAGGDIARYVTSSQQDYDRSIEAWEEGRLGAAAAMKVRYKSERHGLRMFMGRLQSNWLRDAFAKGLRKYNKENEEDFKEPLLVIAAGNIEANARKKKTGWSRLLGDARGELKDAQGKIAYLLGPAYKKAKNNLKSDDTVKDKALRDLEKDYDNARRASVQLKVRFDREAAAVRGRPIFESFLSYETYCLNKALEAVRHGKFITGIGIYRNTANAKTIPAQAAAPAPEAFLDTRSPAEPAGFLVCVVMAAQGVVWLICQHWLFALLFLSVSLAIWALVGGAIHRMAALHAAREEKISIIQALQFSSDKFLSFFTAPLIPLALVLLPGLVLFVGGLIGNLWGFGAILVGILFPIAILLGLLIAFLLVGLVTGAGLMYPTIAVEGSDSFDAMSRSVSYVFARPWRAGLYGTIALIYGTVCYLFVRLFALVALASTHWFVKGGVFGGGSRLAENADKLDLMWQAPTFSNFHAPCSWAAMSGMESVAAFFIAVWVYLVIGLVAAFGLSFLASATTMIYFLLRRKVDATDLDDVYVEEIEEEEPPTAGEEAPATEEPQEGPAEDPSPPDEQSDENRNQ